MRATLTEVAAETVSGIVRPTDRAPRREDLRIRNYDGATHTITVRVSRAGEVAFEAEYAVPADGTVSELDVLERGLHEVTVVVDGERRERLACELDGRTGIIVEIGNGIVAVSDERRPDHGSAV